MQDTPKYYFDVLPIHPPPERLESLTSYLTRLADTNGIDSVGALAAICSPHLNLGGLRRLNDYPPTSFEKLQIVSMCPDAILWRTTFLHIAKKFGRSIEHHSLANFFRDCVSSSLRYCPLCLAEEPYYSLTWRFFLLQGCYKHYCKLLNECSHCGCAVPLLTETLKIGICPACGGDLRKCTPAPLTEKEQQDVLMTVPEIEYLLSPQPFETLSSSTPNALGREFALIRQNKHLTLAQVSAKIGISVTGLSALECGYIGSRTVSFPRYLKYAVHLEVTLSEVFNAMVKRDVKDKQIRTLRGKISLDEDEIVAEVQQAVSELKSLEVQITLDAVSKYVHLSLPRLYKYPKVRLLLMQIKDDNYFDRKRQAEIFEDDMLVRVQNAIQYLDALRRPVSYKSVSIIVGVNQDDFSFYPRAKALLEHSINYPDFKKRQKDLHEEELLMKAKAAIQHLEDSEQLVTPNAVSQLLGIKRSTLYRHPQVEAFLRQKVKYPYVLQRQTRQREDKLFMQVEEAIKQLEALKKPITQYAICKLMGKSPGSFKRYPRVRELLEERTGLHQAYIRSQSRLDEDELLAKVKAAAEELVNLGQPVSRYAIGERVDVPPLVLSRYQRVDIVVKESIEKQRLFHEDELLTRVKTAVRQLEEEKQPITHLAISNRVNLTPSLLYYYPKISSFVKKTINDNRYKLRSQLFLLREDELVEKVLEEIHQLQQLGQPVLLKTIARKVEMTPKGLKHYPRVKGILGQFVKRGPLAKTL